MSETAATFSCTACGRQFTWKKELAGKRAKCKCGQPVDVPLEISTPPAEEDGIYDLSALAADAEKQVAQLGPTIVSAPPPPPRQSGGVAKPKKSKGIAPPKAAERDDSASLVDMNRDIYVPAAMTVVGLGLHLAYYGIRYHMNATQLGAVSAGLSIMALFETIFLIIFALILAGPLGVGFGDFRFAWGKFLATAVFCDGSLAWINGFVAKISGGFGTSAFGYGIIGLPIAFAIYWLATTYLFNLDSGEAATFVVVMTVAYRIVSLLVVVFILSAVMRRTGDSHALAAIPSFGHGGPANPMVDEVENLKDRGQLTEAKEFASHSNRGSDLPAINGWYAAGAPNVWYRYGGMFGGPARPVEIIVELPPEPAGRAKCIDVERKYYSDFGMPFMADSIRDTGDPYLEITIPMPR